MARKGESKEALVLRLAAAEKERDEALYEAAQARAELDALRLALKNRNEVEPPLYPASAGIGPAPLRYVIVDSVNDWAKRLGGPLFTSVRSRLRGIVGR